MADRITGLSSMATRVVLADLAAEIGRSRGLEIEFASGGGVEVARQIRAGAHADIAVLATGAINALATEDLLATRVRPIFISDVVAAVPGGSSVAFETEEHLRTALAETPRIAYSTGPSGTAVLALFDRWQIDPGDRLLQAPPGVPVGSLIADGRADLGFQQNSELLGVPGIRILGPLPGDAAIRSVFSGAVLATSLQRDVAEVVLDAITDPSYADLVTARGMTLSPRPGN